MARTLLMAMFWGLMLPVVGSFSSTLFRPPPSTFAPVAPIAPPAAASAGGVAPKSFTVPFTAPDCCAMCGRAGAKMRCARCQRVRYCSGPCQVQHWKKGGHRKECGKQQGAAALADAPPSLEVASEAEIAAYDLPD